MSNINLFFGSRRVLWFVGCLACVVGIQGSDAFGQYNLPSQSGAKSGPLAAREVEESAHLVGHENPLLMKRIEDALQEWDPRYLDSPYIKRIYTDEGKRFALRRPDLAEFVTDVDEAVALGKALFWDMQLGSDYGRKASDGNILGTACASCHYRFGADARDRNTQAMAYQAWDKFGVGRDIDQIQNDLDEKQIPPKPFTQLSLPFEPEGEKPVDAKLFQGKGLGLFQHEMIGSQGIQKRLFNGFDWDGIEVFKPVGRPDWGYLAYNMFGQDEKVTRQVTRRNSPSVINSVFNDRQFHDGRAESTFNGFSIFGDFDKRLVLKKAMLDPSGKLLSYHPVSVAIVNASLASQAVGPVVNDVEMSYTGRTFHDIAMRLLCAQPLASQTTDTADSLLRKYVRQEIVQVPDQAACCTTLPGLYDPSRPGEKLSYREWIKKAFRKEWWDNSRPLTQEKSLVSRLDHARAHFELVLSKSSLQGDLAVGVQQVLGDKSLRFPAERVLLSVEAYGKSHPDLDNIQLQQFTDLLHAAQEWAGIEGEILPLRTAVYDIEDLRTYRLRLDEELANVAICGDPDGMLPQDDLMVNNFSLYFGIAVMLYESTLISNDSPFDQMLRGNPAGVEDVWQKSAANSAVLRLEPNPAENNRLRVLPEEPNSDDVVRKVMLDKFPTLNAPPVLDATGMFQRGLRVFVRNCAECHEPPFFTTATNLELVPELPDPIAKIHSYTLVRKAFADAFKERMIAQGVPPGVGVNDNVRPLLGNRRFFFDQERIPEIEALVGPLLIELMGIPIKRPTAIVPVTVAPGAGLPNRNPMITWLGTRPPLEFAPSPQPGEDPVDPYAFYDLGYYNLGVSEPRYDWGVWAYSGSEESISIEEVLQLLREEEAKAFLKSGVDEKTLSGLKALVEKTLEDKKLKDEDEKAPGAASIPSLGNAYRLPKLKRGRDTAVVDKKKNQEILDAIALAPKSVREDAKLLLDYITTRGVDHSANRSFLDYAKFGQRKDIHFFKRARRMVMTEETWGHRKPFISDNELMGWGAFKTPSLRNIALTEPYMHNGRFLSLRQVLDFYSFDNPYLIPADPVLNPDLHPDMGRLPLNDDGVIAGAPDGKINLVQVQDSESLLFFLLCLTDQRVQYEKAPFDHPSIRVVNGFQNSQPENEFAFEVPAVGAGGHTTPPSQFPSSN
ncbi:MAG: cytochrome c peroxidase [Planctomycetota bacterium]